MAKLIGAIPNDTESASDRLAGAHVVAACVPSASAIVLTADPGDIAALAAALPGSRVLTRDPVKPFAT